MATAPTNTIWVALGVGVGVLLVDLLLGASVGVALLKGVLAACIAAGLITLFERGGRR